MKHLTISILFILITINMQAQKKKLYGSWQASNGTLTTFTPQTMTMAGSTYKYKVIGNIIRVFDEVGNTLDYKYKIQNNQLYLYVEGYGTYILQKVSGNRQVGYGNQQYGQRNRGNGGGNSAYNTYLYGTFCSYSSSGYNSSGSYSTVGKVYFDGRGNFQYGSESSYSGGGDGYYGGGGDERGRYTVQGNRVLMQFSDGSQIAVQIYVQQNSGEITELMYDGTLYAKALCE
jgi:hypothetical protein